MEKMKYEKLTDLQGRLEANMVESYLEAQGIDVELIQESLGQSSYAVSVNGLGRVQVFVPKDQIEEARQLLKTYREGFKGQEDDENQ
jgi:hypothetical protein